MASRQIKKYCEASKLKNDNAMQRQKPKDHGGLAGRAPDLCIVTHSLLISSENFGQKGETKRRKS